MAGTSYTRQSTITDGNLITAAIFNNEYNQLLNAFAYATSSTTGHQHDGSAGQGGNIAKIGDQDFKNKVVISATNNRIEFYSEVSNSPVEQVRIQDGLITPVTDSDVDLGTTSVRFKNAFVDSVTVTNNIVVGGTVDGRDVATDGTKLDAIEASATADQTNAEIRTAVEAASDSNVFTDADHSKLNAIEASATADQTDAQIRAAVEAATDSNVFTDADHTKLNAIEASADVTDTANVTAAGALMDSEVTNLAQVKAFASSDYATAAQGVLAAAALPKSGGAMTGAITTNSTFDGVDIATRDGVLSSTTTTANAALPKAGGAMTGAITTNSTFDGRDVATDGTKLDGIEASATADQTAAEIRAAVEAATNSNVFTDADHSKLNALEASGDVTDTANVTAAGALMDSELTNLAQVKAFDSSDYATAAQGTLAAAALPKSGGVMTGALTVGVNDTGYDVKFFGATAGKSLLWDESADSLIVTGSDAGTAGLFVESNTAGVGARLDTIDATLSNNAALTNSLLLDSDNHAIIRTDSNNNGSGDFYITESSSDTARMRVANNGDVSFYNTAGTTAKLFWDASAESLGLGTTSPSRPLHISTAVDTVALFESTDSNSRIELKDGAGSSFVENGGGILRLKADSANAVANSRIDFTIDNSEKARIDTSGNLLVGTTSVQGAGGVTLAGAGYVYSSRPSSTAIYADRTGSDGAIQEFRKGGTTIGSIGTQGGDKLTIGNGDVGIAFNPNADSIYPWNTATNAARDASVDLGYSNIRFRNAYLSGNANVDGTVEFNGLSGTGAVTVTNILDEDNMASNSATALATQQSIKAYVDANAGGDGGGETLQQTLAIGNTVTTDTKIQFRDTGLYINSSADGQLDIVADTEVQLAATTFDINAAVVTNGDVTVGDDLSLLSDSSKLNFGLNSDVSLTHQHNSGLLLNSTRKLYFNDTSQYIHGSDTTRLKMGATNEIELNAAVIDVNGNLDVSGNIIIAGTVDGVDIATRDGVLTTTTNTANAALPKAGGAMTGAITTNSTFDGRDVAADGVTADAALPKAGGAMTGAITTNSTFDGRDVAADGVTADAALPKAGGAMTGAITTNSTFDGRDVAADGVTADAALPKAGGAMTGAITTNSTFDGVDIATRDGVLTTTTNTANAALPKAGGTMTGVAVFAAGITEDAVTLTGTSTTIDISAATNFVHDLTGATTYTFSNPASTGNASSFTLKIIQGSTARAITWPSSVDWAGGTAPTLTGTNNGVDVFVFYTIDGGTIYYGFTAGQAMA